MKMKTAKISWSQLFHNLRNEIPAKISTYIQNVTHMYPSFARTVFQCFHVHVGCPSGVQMYMYMHVYNIHVHVHVLYMYMHYTCTCNWEGSIGHAMLILFPYDFRCSFSVQFSVLGSVPVGKDGCRYLDKL